MKITTANVKNPAYNAQHEIFVGTHTGSFKKIDVTADNPHAQTNLQEIAALNKFSRITSLNFGSSRDELIIGRANKFIKVYDASAGAFTSSVEMLDAPIVGAGRFENRLVAGIGTGRIQILAHDAPTVLETGDHLSTLTQCAQDARLVATGGKDRQNAVKVWDLEALKCVFQAKNVANDFLQLEVPVWETAVRFADDGTANGAQLLTCSRHGYIRRYDTRVQRRPVSEYRNEKEPIAYNCLATFGDQLFVGTSTGIVRSFDQRRLKVVQHTYKGFAGSISDVGVDETGAFVYSASLDRYVRVHGVESTALMYQCYVKSKATKVLLRTKPVAEREAVEEDEETATTGLNDSDCVCLGAEEDEEDEEAENGADAAGSDPEFDELFDNMRTVRDGESESSSDDEDTKPAVKKRKLTNKKQHNRTK